MAYHMFFGFDLKDGISLDEARASMEALSDTLRTADLILDASPIAKRNRHPVLDTASNIEATYFAQMRFRDRKQADAAVKEIYAHQGAVETAHVAFIVTGASAPWYRLAV